MTELGENDRFELQNPPKKSIGQSADRLDENTDGYQKHNGVWSKMSIKVLRTKLERQRT